MYDITSKGNKYGEGAAVAIIVLVLVAILIVPYLVCNSKQKTENQRRTSDNLHNFGGILNLLSATGLFDAHYRDEVI